MTGLYNRCGLDTILKYWHTLHRDFAIIALDIDNFKQVNDTLGHDTGDAVIKFIAKQLRDCSRGSDILCRGGGEEFLVLLPETSQNICRADRRGCAPATDGGHNIACGSYHRFTRRFL
ncbi:MAG: GGDEF domain-containing protein [Symbiopectobacterium sp.]